MLGDDTWPDQLNSGHRQAAASGAHVDHGGDWFWFDRIGSGLANPVVGAYISGERLARAGASPTRSGPEGSSRNETRLGRVQPLTLYSRPPGVQIAAMAHRSGETVRYDR